MVRYKFEDKCGKKLKCLNGLGILTHSILNRLSHTIYWKSPISIFGTSGYEIYTFLEKNV